MDKTASFDAILGFNPGFDPGQTSFSLKKKNTHTQIKVQCKPLNKRKKCEYHTLT